MPDGYEDPNFVDLKEITLFQHIRYGGAKLVLPPGPHDMNDLSVTGFAYKFNPVTRHVERVVVEKLGNDAVSSIHIPWGRAVMLFSDAKLEGQRLFLPDGFHNLTDYQGPGRDGTWNDVLSSIMVFNTHEEAVFFEDSDYRGDWSGYRQGVQPRNAPSGLISSCFLSAGILAGVNFTNDGRYPTYIHPGATPYLGHVENDKIQGIHTFKNQTYGTGVQATVERSQSFANEICTVTNGPANSECLIWTQPPQTGAAYRQIMTIKLNGQGMGRHTRAADSQNALWGVSRRYALFVDTSEFIEF